MLPIEILEYIYIAQYHTLTPDTLSVGLSLDQRLHLPTAARLITCLVSSILHKITIIIYGIYIIGRSGVLVRHWTSPPHRLRKGVKGKLYLKKNQHTTTKTMVK